MSATLTSRQWLAYGALGLPLAMAALPVYVHVPRFYADTIGMDLALLGGILLFARLADAALDPLIGWWSDRSGWRRPLIVLALPCLALGMLALLRPGSSAGAGWLVGALVLTYTGFSLATVALQAMGAELGRNSEERTVLTASREGFGLLGVVAAAVLPALLAQDEALAFSRLAWLFVLLLLLFAGITLWGTPRLAHATPTALSPSAPLAPLADPGFRRLLALYLASGIAAALPATLVLFYVDDVLQAKAWNGVFLALYFLAGALALPLWVRLARRIGRMRAWVLGMLLAAVAFIWTFGLGQGDIAAFAAISVLSGLAFGADLALPAALLADLARRAPVPGQSGTYFGWWGLFTKLNLALAAGIGLPLLAHLGYRPNDAASATVLAAVYCLVPVTLKLLAAALAWRWRRTLEIES